MENGRLRAEAERLRAEVTALSASCSAGAVGQLNSSYTRALEPRNEARNELDKAREEIKKLGPLPDGAARTSARGIRCARASSSGPRRRCVRLR